MNFLQKPHTAVTSINKWIAWSVLQLVWTVMTLPFDASPVTQHGLSVVGHVSAPSFQLTKQIQ
jgi:hypothetical protein